MRVGPDQAARSLRLATVPLMALLLLPVAAGPLAAEEGPAPPPAPIPIDLIIARRAAVDPVLYTELGLGSVEINFDVLEDISAESFAVKVFRELNNPLSTKPLLTALVGYGEVTIFDGDVVDSDQIFPGVPETDQAWMGVDLDVPIYFSGEDENLLIGIEITLDRLDNGPVVPNLRVVDMPLADSFFSIDGGATWEPLTVEKLEGLRNPPALEASTYIRLNSRAGPPGT